MMKKTLIASLLIGLALITIYGCAKVATTGGGGSIQPLTNVGTLTGQVTQTDGTTALAGVTVTAAGTTAATNTYGWFAISNLTAGQAIVSFSLTDYVTIQKSVLIEAGKSKNVTVSLVAMPAAQNLNVPAGDTIISGTTAVVFPANALEPVSGTGTVNNANVSIAAPTFSSSADADAFPGGFTGVTTTGATVGFDSYGWIDVLATGPGNQTMQIKNGQLVMVSMLNKGPATPESTQVPVWYFDHATATWLPIKDAAGKQIIASYEATTNSFVYYVPGGGAWSVLGGQPWNVDLPRSSWAYISGKVIDSSGVPVLGASIKVYSSLNNWSSETAGDISRTDGSFGPIPVPPDMSLYVYAVSGAVKSPRVTVPALAAATYTSTSPYDVGNLVLDSARLQFTLTWGVDPGDLDSHLTIPKISAEATYRYHLYFSNRNSTPSTSYPYAHLDTDDMGSYGPEHTTVYRLYDGIYRFCVHHFSGSSDIEHSSAQVTLNVDDGRGTTGTYIWAPPSGQPTDGLHTVWQVCDVTVASGRVTGVATIGDYKQPGKDAYDPNGEPDQVYTTSTSQIKMVK